MSFQSPDSFMMTEGRQILEWLGEEMKRRGVTHLDIPWPEPTPEDLARQRAVERLHMEVAAYPAKMLMDIMLAEPVR